MTNIPGCGHGGWTLIMKIDGTKPDFNYTSPYWTNNETYAVEDGLKGLTEKQSKLASYWNTPFSKICLGMKVNNVTKWIATDHEASSLSHVITHGRYTSTSFGKEAWKSLVNDSLIQVYCNYEGFNVQVEHNFNADAYIKTRIGIVANNYDQCVNCDSCIGFGISFLGCDGHKRYSSCGDILGICTAPENDGETAAFGYVLVQ